LNIVDLSVNKRSIIFAVTAMVVATLACARGDVEIAGNSNPIEYPIDQQPTQVIVQSTPTPTISSGVHSTATPSRPTPVASPTLPPTPTLSVSGVAENLLYESQPGDVLRNLAIRFGVIPSDIRATSGLLPQDGGLVDPGLILVIPDRLENPGPSDRLLPDSEVVYSPHTADFDVSAFVSSQGGFLNTYTEYVAGVVRSGAEIVDRAALAHSINPRLLLAFLEDSSGWVTNPAQPSGDALNYPIGMIDIQHQGLYKQLSWLSNELGKGYYGWRSGTMIDLVLADGSYIRMSPIINAGTVAIQYLFSLKFPISGWTSEVGPDGFISIYDGLFGDPWEYFHPLYEPELQQPPMTLPFMPGKVWSFTGGPHGAWEREAAWAALDFAPPSSEPGCVDSEEWVVAASPGLVVRSDNGLVVVDLDGDGLEQTGWVVLYLHIATRDRIHQGVFIEQGDLIGHPSCEGGTATGTHVHLARKYNGEWVLADGPLAFELSGWVARAGSMPYEGALVKGGQTVLACPCSSQETLISR
jgi:murein DD-endopeptidase MepM/ murein hydrolase activator NlpD